MPAEVLVIGAGPAGIACAYFLQKAGIRYRVVDQAQVIASTWADQYPSLRLNTSRFFSHMPGQRFPLRCGIFPSARQYHAYLEDFVVRQHLNIHLGVQIDRVTPDGEGWRVDSREGAACYPAVVLATGRFPKPYRAKLNGLSRFTGTVIHSQEFKDPAAFTGQRVMIVGNGPSGVDLAVALPQTAQLPVYLAQRTGIILRPRYPYGLPKHAWTLLAEWLPGHLTRWLERRALAAQFRHVERSGLQVPASGQESGAAATRGPELMEAAQAGQVRSARLYPFGGRKRAGNVS
ncbi:MAG: NAD(P)/FAD-dependent oxidoreductase [Anaerolineae bacterium]|nr:NAD(P)/FAD-dependent oxidoreductase [Anaerolineae bacterium]